MISYSLLISPNVPSTATRFTPRSFYGMANGFLLYVATCCMGQMTGGALNPALAVGAYLSRWMWNCTGCSGSWTDFDMVGFDDCWVSMAVPMAGALVAGVLFKACTEGYNLPCKCKKKPRAGGEEGDDGSYDGMERISSLPPPMSEGGTPIAEMVEVNTDGDRGDVSAVERRANERAGRNGGRGMGRMNLNRFNNSRGAEQDEQRSRDPTTSI
mmetsp:Transcript_19835/g.41220  ORF Transcript_19835/g.41220 Transcript_19835/m.41220 type:complete len:213 (-) Transcript_19835:24-662(-)